MVATRRYGLTGTWNQLIGVKLDIDDAIEILDVSDVPFQSRLPSVGTNSIKVEWLEEELSPQTVTIATSGVSGTASPWSITVGSTEASLIRPGDVLHLQGAAYDIQYLVSSVDPDTDVLVVTSFAATADTDDPADADVLELIGQYRNEGADPEEARSSDRTTKYNYTQVAQEAVEATRTDRKRANYALSDPYEHEVGKKFKELAIRFEKNLVNGYRAFSADSKKRAMGGAFYYITTNARSSAAASVKTTLNTLLRDCYNAGGTPRTVMVSPNVKQAISANVDAALRRSTVSERTGGSVIDRFLSDFGEVDLVINRHFPTTKGLVFADEYLKRRPFDGYFHEMLAKTGDADKGQIVGEFSFEVKNEKAAGVLTVTDA